MEENNGLGQGQEAGQDIPEQNLNEQQGNETGETGVDSENVQEQIKTAIAEAQKQWEAEFDKQLNKARSEGERLANLSGKEREAESERIEKEAYEKKIAEFEHDKLIFETGKILAERDLSPSFAEFLAQNDAETTKSNIERFEKLWNTEHQKRVDNLIKGTPPKTPGGVAGKPEESTLAETLGKKAGMRAKQSNDILSRYIGN